MPWPVFKQVLERIHSVKSKEEYVKMVGDGDTMLDILPGGVLQRTPVPFEMHALGRFKDADRKGRAGTSLLAMLATKIHGTQKPCRNVSCALVWDT